MGALWDELNEREIPVAAEKSRVDNSKRAPMPGEAFTVYSRPVVKYVTGYDENRRAWIVMTDRGEFAISRDAEGQWAVHWGE